MTTHYVIAKMRPYIEKIPMLAHCYRGIRHRLSFLIQPFEDTPFGFMLKGNHLMASGQFESAQTQLMSELMEDSDVFVDVGANIGYYTCHAAKKGKQVLAVEPLAENLDYLRENVRVNGFGGIEIREMVLGESSGSAVLHGASTGASLVGGWAQMSPLLRRTVLMDSLDNILRARDAGRRLLIKIDVEGAELRVLRGAVKVLRGSPPPAWVVEIGSGELHPSHMNSDFEETFSTFWREGYASFMASPPREPVMERGVKERARSGVVPPGNANYLFLKGELR